MNERITQKIYCLKLLKSIWIFMIINWCKKIPWKLEHSNLFYINMHLYQLSIISVFTIVTDFLPCMKMQFFLSYINNFLDYHINLHSYQCRYKYWIILNNVLYHSDISFMLWFENLNYKWQKRKWFWEFFRLKVSLIV